jgi:hypothetical protein
MVKVKDIDFSSVIDNFDDLEIDDNKSKTMKRVNLSISIQQFENIQSASDNLSELLRTDSFKAFLRTLLDSDKEVSRYCNSLFNLVDIHSNVNTPKNSSSKPKKSQSESAKKNSFFTKEWPRTDALNTLEALCNTELDTVTITSVKNLLNSYIKNNDLEDTTKNITLDDEIYNISPESFDKKSYTNSEWKSISLTFAKNVLNWVSSSSK